MAEAVPLTKAESFILNICVRAQSATIACRPLRRYFSSYTSQSQAEVRITRFLVLTAQHNKPDKSDHGPGCTRGTYITPTSSLSSQWS